MEIPQEFAFSISETIVSKLIFLVSTSLPFEGDANFNSVIIGT